VKIRIAIAVATALVAVATMAPTAGAAGGQAAATGKIAGEEVATVRVTHSVGQLFRAGGDLRARGRVNVTAVTADGTVYRTSKSVVYRARTLAQAHRGVCQVLFLTLGPLDLELLGLRVHLDRVTLRITANRRGGILGQLLCGLAGQRLNTRAGVTAWNRNVGRVGTLPASEVTIMDHQGVCPVLDLTLGPLDLRVLGLRIQLSRVHLVVTAERGHGILGDLLCGLAGGVPPPLPTP
jgi:hypothetical protein